MFMSNFQSFTNLGGGLKGLYRITPGQTLAITLTATNAYDGYYGLVLNQLNGSGLSNTTHHLVFTPDPTWSDYGGYYAVEPTTTLQKWIFNLTLASNTPPDIYPIEAQMAGKDANKTRWSQVQDFYIQVVAPAVLTAPTPTLTGMQKSGTTFSTKVITTNGFTYYLDYRTNLTAGTWANAAQVTGDNTSKTLADPNASDRQRFYRVRVQ